MTQVEQAVDALLFQIDKSMRYHQRRRGFYDLGYRVLMLTIIVSGSLAAVYEWKQIGLGAVIAAISLVWSPAYKARSHEMLFRSFTDLSIEMQSKTWTASNYRKWKTKRVKIEGDEPPIYYALEADCENQVRRAWGRDQKLLRIAWWRRLTMSIWHHRPGVYPEYEPPNRTKPPTGNRLATRST